MHVLDSLEDAQAGDSPSRRLRQKIALVLPELSHSGSQLINHPRIAELYPDYLFTLHCIIRASVPVMQTALECARPLAKDDPAAATLTAYLTRHIHEEMHHDEWLLDDLAVLGLERSGVLSRPPSPTVAALVGSQYYWAVHFHPVAVLGYIAVLEGNPPSREMIDDLIARSAYRSEAFRTLLKHAELDPDHGRELDETLDELRLTSEQEIVLGINAMSTVHMFGRSISELLQRFSQ